jgi:hypothetical protein
VQKIDGVAPRFFDREVRYEQKPPSGGFCFSGAPFPLRFPLA